MQELKYINGLRAVCVILIVVLHYWLAFDAAGFIGFGITASASEKIVLYRENFTQAVFLNNSFSLRLLFTLIGFLGALSFFSGDGAVSVQKAALKRYIRLVIPVFGCVLIGWALAKLGLDYTRQLHAATGSEWLLSVGVTETGFLTMLKAALIDVLLVGDSRFGSVLWCFHIIFAGSMLTYFFLLVAGTLPGRRHLYPPLCALCVFFPDYLAFLAGVMCADFYRNDTGATPEPEHRLRSWLQVLLGIFIGCFPVIWLPPWLDSRLLYGTGGALLLAGIMRNDTLRRWLSAAWLQPTGHLAFALILVHFHVMISLSAWLFLRFQQGWPGSFAGSLALTLLLSLPATWLISAVFQRVFDKTADRLAGKVATTLINP